MDTYIQSPLFPSAAAAKAALIRIWNWPHFSISELACRCGGRFCRAQYWHDPEFLDALEYMRAQTGRPLIINSGHRCPQWNALVGGAPASMHKTIAADISLITHDRHEMLGIARSAGFRGLGLGRSFLHIDRRKRPAQWYYQGSTGLWKI